MTTRDLGPAVHWSSSIDGPLGTGAMVTTTSLSPGAHLITATVDDQDGAEASASVSVVVAAATLTFTAVEDTYVDAAAPSTKLGTATTLWEMPGGYSPGAEHVLTVDTFGTRLIGYLDGVIYFAGSTAVEGPPEEVISTETLSTLYGVAIEVLRASDGRLVVVGAPDLHGHHAH